MQQYDWNVEKNKILKESKGISFEEILNAIDNGEIIDIFSHPNQKRYPNQEIHAINIDDYIFLVPFVTRDEAIFLKTRIPSRKATKNILKAVKNEK